jgi:AcrR family transcriptional regulator
MEEIKDTEKQILNAAKEIFLQKGFDGARMQDIADKAGINKAMLHYYFRSKDRLFESVFRELTSNIFPKLFQSLMSEMPFEEKLKSIVNNYMDFLVINPDLPLFVFREINSNPERIANILKDVVKIDDFKNQLKGNVDNAISESGLENIDATQVVLTLLGACIFPAIAKNLIKIVFKMTEDDYVDLMIKRKEQLPKILINGLKK